MALLDFLNTSLVINIGTLVLLVVLVGGLYAYFSSKLSVQDHKISSMVSCVSTMAEEIQFFRKQINEQCGHTEMINSVHLPSHTLVGRNDLDRRLIEVSDDDSDNEDDETDNEDEDDDTDNEDEDDDTDNEDENDDAHDDNEDIGVHDILDHPVDIHKIIDIEDNDHLSQLDDLSVNDNIKTIHIDEDNDNLMLDEDNIDLTKLPIPHIKEEPHTKEDLVNSDSLKTISLVDMDHDDYTDHDDTQDLDQDYKKMNLTKLREIVVKKKLTNDASKMKKNDILKLLGVE